ncbi:putative multidrug export ATP-binding/permease protein [compost metagenome]
MEKRVSLKFTEYWHAISQAFFRQHMYWFGNRALQAFKDFFITRMNLYFIGGLLILHGDMTVGGLLVFMKYYEQMFTQLGMINDLDMQFTGELPGLEKVKAILTESGSGHSDNTVRLAGAGENQSQSQHQPLLHAANVSFRYDGTDQQVLREVTFGIPAGSRTAIVGRSGSGKSTVAKLLAGMYQPDTGEIRIEGKNIVDSDKREQHRYIGIVMQDPAIFNMSILENISLARPKAADLEIQEACRLANMQEFIERLPLQYDTVIGEKGVQLSGGQKQRLALARVLLSNSPIIVLDEATSMLDHESETEINRTLGSLAGERTVIVIAHRLTSVMQAEQIILLDEGRIADSGTHSELVQRSALYRTLFRQQLQEPV